MIRLSTTRHEPDGRAIDWRPAGLGAAALLLALLIARLPLLYSAAVLGGLALVALVMAHPLAGLGLALLVGPFGALEKVILGGAVPLDSGQLVLLLTIGAWLAAGLARRRIWLARTPVNLPLAAFVLVAAATLVGADSLPLGLRELLKWLEVGLIVLLVMDVATDGGRNRRRLAASARWLLGFLLLAGLTQAAIGVWQFGPRGAGPEHFLVLGRFYRAYGTFEQPNPFGGYMNLTALLALGTAWGLLVSRFGRSPGPAAATEPPVLAPLWAWLVGAGLVGAVAGVALVFSWSRGAWMGFLAGLAVLVLFSARRLWIGAVLLGLGALVLGGGLLGGVAAGLGPAQSLADRLLGFREDFTFGDVRGVDINDANYAVLERLAHWQAAAGMARDDLWTGVGFGNFEAAYPDYALINWPAALGHAHNYYLNLLAETGVVGLLAYGLLWLVIVGQTVWVMGRLDWPDRGIVLGLLAAWAALTVHQLVDKLYVNNIYVHLGAMIALLQLISLRVNGRQNRLGIPDEISPE